LAYWKKHEDQNQNVSGDYTLGCGGVETVNSEQLKHSETGEIMVEPGL
jgi:hypothetical protein